MKRALLVAAAAFTLLAGANAMAQSVSIEIDGGQRTRIKEYVVKQKVQPYAAKERFTVGARIPAEVELRAVPSEWGPSVSKYRYIYSNDRVYFVDPANRTILREID